MNRTLTGKMKVEFFQILLRRDGGFNCFYCRCDLLNISWVYEHLDNNSAHSQIENIVLSCQSCNVKKKNDFDMQLLALEKKKQNEKSNYPCEREKIERSGPTLSPEMDANQQNFEITKQYVSEIIETDGSIEFKDAMDSVAYTCFEKTGTGSQVSVRRYLDALCSQAGPFKIIDNEKKKRSIVKRTGQ
ncbi:HNH endonuclease signature motif containing protein [Nitrosopumilus adriaticus]|uniref:HNH nuclease domain-containing protein n=1 Tax=Nitrosopumilus adriaticus TaxID=1580092 RepID=A0A0D5C5V2_9ARCH|nr:HNH endonuclease signature motif containing protein [Nitrosopumilus adriaticus]AJW71745.1 hypothetical protein NADRNF5_2071 [Nitrosopumilus adriaticus]